MSDSPRQDAVPRWPRRCLLACALCIALVCPARIATAQAAPDTPPGPAGTTPEEALPPLRDSLVWRLGPSLHGLFSSGQGRPFVYPTLAVRLKDDELYLDGQLGFVLGGIDAGQFFARRALFDSNAAFNLFEAFNNPAQFAFMEVTHLRLGRSVPRRIFAERDGTGGMPLRLAFGVMGVGDWVVFDLRGAPKTLDEVDLGDVVARDPVIAALGAFGAVCVVLPSAALDLSLGIGRDLFDLDEYAGDKSWVFTSDLDVQVDLYGDWGLFVRARLAAYTYPTRDMVWTSTGSFGVSFRIR